MNNGGFEIWDYLFGIWIFGFCNLNFVIWILLFVFYFLQFLQSQKILYLPSIMESTKTILITGGAGFIGSHVTRLFVNKYPDYKIINLDKLTYAGNLENLADISGAPNYTFIKGDICNAELVNELFLLHQITHVVHTAAESHVDRSISNPMDFVSTNVIGTCVLLNAAKHFWKKEEAHLFYHISTDEVYGALGETGLFTEHTKYDPHSPYSASKASSDHFVRAYADTYGLPIVISNCSNNYGPYHFPEKLIPLCIHNIIEKKPLPIYGKGENVRDWLFVEDHAAAIDTIFHNGKHGETYNIGGHNEWTNIDLVKVLCRVMDEKLGREKGESEQLITYVTDRAGHDMRYAIDATKIKNELGWQPSLQFEEGVGKTIDWYLANKKWLANVTSGNYQQYYDTQYQDR
jgi:dTDP-glucose 4,6-dehydratase